MTEELPGPISELVRALGDIPTVEAVSLGGSRAHGTARSDSDWDLGVYYRSPFDPDHVRALGYEGTVVDIGEWGGGVFNGGAWLTVGGESVDLLWRDLDVVEHEIAEAEAGRWRTEELMFHLVGIPTYLVVAELALHRVLIGQLPVPAYPEALRAAASRGWADRAELTLQHARVAHASHGRVTQCLGLIAIGAAEYAHADAAANAVWVTNDKTLLELGHMSAVDAVVAALESSPAGLRQAVDAVIALGRANLSVTHDEEG